MLGMAGAIVGGGRDGGGGRGSVIDCCIEDISGKVCKNSS